MRPAESELADEVRAWLTKAWKDLWGAQIDLAASPPFVEDALFHCQQAAEKALKDFLTWRQQVFGKTHDLLRLGRQCAKADATLETVVDEASSLTKYAWMYPYPGEAPEPSVEEARRASAAARKVVESISVRLPAEMRPRQGHTCRGTSEQTQSRS